MIFTLDFSVDKENNTINIKRVFKADIATVWEAWTNPTLLDQWWAPKPYKTQTKSMDFRAGGCWLYAMLSPEGAAHWCKAEYKTVDPLHNYSALDAFCDEEGNVNLEFPRSFWTNTFINEEANTMVEIQIKYDSLEDLEKIIQLGFKEGFTMALGNLDELLAAIE
jgi:PhnB protein